MNNYKKMREYTHEEFINLISNMSEEELLSFSANYGGYPVLLQAAIDYCNAEESRKYFKDIETNSDGSIPLKYACEAIFEAIRKSKLADLEYVKEQFDKHITYERK